MKATVNHNGKTVEIDLTPEQETEVKRKTFNYQDIKTVEDAFNFLGENYQDWCETHKDLDAHVKAYIQLTLVAKAVNGGEWLDYIDTNVYKYYPWFYAVGSPSGFSFGDYDYDRTYSCVGSRLTFRTREIAIYAAKQFTSLYNQYINS